MQLIHMHSFIIHEFNKGHEAKTDHVSNSLSALHVYQELQLEIVFLWAALLHLLAVKQ